MRGPNIRTKVVVPLSVVVPSVFCIFLSWTTAQALTVDEYFQCQIALLEISIAEQEERAEFLSRASSKKESYVALANIAQKYLDIKASALREYGTDIKEIMNFASKHNQELGSFLERSPHIQDEMNALLQELASIQSESMEAPKD